MKDGNIFRLASTVNSRWRDIRFILTFTILWS